MWRISLITSILITGGVIVSMGFRQLSFTIILVVGIVCLMIAMRLFEKQRKEEERFAVNINSKQSQSRINLHRILSQTGFILVIESICVFYFFIIE